MTRWIAIKPYIDIDQNPLTRIIVYPEGVNKESVRSEHGEYYHERNVLIKRGNGYEFKE